MHIIMVQARMSAMRLPAKVIQPINGVPMILRQLERLKMLGEPIVVLIPRTDVKSPLHHILIEHGYEVEAPPANESDVLGRYAWAIRERDVSHWRGSVIRVTADCPFIDPALIREGIQYYENGEANFVTLGPSYPEGLDFEIVDPKLVLEADTYAKTASDREHVTPIIWGHRIPSRVVSYYLSYSSEHSPYSLSVDTPLDLAFARELYELLGDKTDWRCVIGLLLAQGAEHLLKHATSKRINAKYLEALGTDKSWAEVRYGDPKC